MEIIRNFYLVFMSKVFKNAAPNTFMKTRKRRITGKFEKDN
jgi:hypothetical protein